MGLLRAAHRHDSQRLDERIKHLLRLIDWPSFFSLPDVMDRFANAGVFVYLPAVRDMIARESAGIRLLAEKREERAMVAVLTPMFTTVCSPTQTNRSTARQRNRATQAAILSSF